MKDNLLYTFSNNELHFGLSKKNLLSLTQNYKGPAYVYDLGFIGRQVDLYFQNLPAQAKIFYAVKANANAEILKYLKAKGVNVDVVSIGEIKCALEAGFNPKQIIFSGVGKTAIEIKFAIEKKIHQINIESISELKRVVQIATELQKKIDVAVRINPDISVDTHPYISTGLKENKFGLEIGQLDEFAQVLKAQKFVSWKGLSIHLGSQIFDVEPLGAGVQTLLEMANFYKAQFPELTRIDLGGGLGIDYHSFDFEREQKIMKAYGQMVSDVLKGTSFEIMVEPGRSLVGHAGVLITQIQYIKKNKHKTFVIVDSGMNHLIRPSLYQAYHQIVPLKYYPDLGFQCDVVGPICETSDFFARNYQLPFCQEGDFLAICDTGAYGYSMASRYNQTELPAEICLNADKAF